MPYVSEQVLPTALASAADAPDSVCERGLQKFPKAPAATAPFNFDDLFQRLKNNRTADSHSGVLSNQQWRQSEDSRDHSESVISGAGNGSTSTNSDSRSKKTSSESDPLNLPPSLLADRLEDDSSILRLNAEYGADCLKNLGGKYDPQNDLEAGAAAEFRLNLPENVRKKLFLDRSTADGMGCGRGMIMKVSSATGDTNTPDSRGGHGYDADYADDVITVRVVPTVVPTVAADFVTSGPDRFYIRRKLGQGSFAKVYQVERLTNFRKKNFGDLDTNMAIKVLSCSSEAAFEKVRTEIRHHSLFSTRSSKESSKVVRLLGYSYVSNSISTGEDSGTDSDSHPDPLSPSFDYSGHGGPGGVFLLFLEHAPAGSLTDWIQKRVYNESVVLKNDSDVSESIKAASNSISTARALPVAVLEHVFLEVTQALVEIHAAGVLHADIKPDNFLVFESEAKDCEESEENPLRLPEIKLCDFGISCSIDLGSSDGDESDDSGEDNFTNEEKISHLFIPKRIGTVPFMAPEMIFCADFLNKSEGINTQPQGDNTGEGLYVNRGIDIWSAGILFFLCLYGDYPRKHWGESATEIMFNIVRRDRVDNNDETVGGESKEKIIFHKSFERWIPGYESDSESHQPGIHRSKPLHSESHREADKTRCLSLIAVVRGCLERDPASRLTALEVLAGLQERDPHSTLHLLLQRRQEVEQNRVLQRQLMYGSNCANNKNLVGHNLSSNSRNLDSDHGLYFPTNLSMLNTSYIADRFKVAIVGSPNRAGGEVESRVLNSSKNTNFNRFGNTKFSKHKAAASSSKSRSLMDSHNVVELEEPQAVLGTGDSVVSVTVAQSLDRVVPKSARNTNVTPPSPLESEPGPDEEPSESFQKQLLSKAPPGPGCANVAEISETEISETSEAEPTESTDITDSNQNDSKPGPGGGYFGSRTTLFLVVSVAVLLALTAGLAVFAVRGYAGSGAKTDSGAGGYSGGDSGNGDVVVAVPGNFNPEPGFAEPELTDPVVKQPDDVNVIRTTSTTSTASVRSNENLPAGKSDSEAAVVVTYASPGGNPGAGESELESTGGVTSLNLPDSGIPEPLSPETESDSKKPKESESDPVNVPNTTNVDNQNHNGLQNGACQSQVVASPESSSSDSHTPEPGPGPRSDAPDLKLNGPGSGNFPEPGLVPSPEAEAFPGSTPSSHRLRLNSDNPLVLDENSKISILPQDLARDLAAAVEWHSIRAVTAAVKASPAEWQPDPASWRPTEATLRYTCRYEERREDLFPPEVGSLNESNECYKPVTPRIGHLEREIVPLLLRERKCYCASRGPSSSSTRLGFGPGDGPGQSHQPCDPGLQLSEPEDPSADCYNGLDQAAPDCYYGLQELLNCQGEQNQYLFGDARTKSEDWYYSETDLATASVRYSKLIDRAVVPRLAKRLGPKNSSTSIESGPGESDYHSDSVTNIGMKRSEQLNYSFLQGVAEAAVGYMQGNANAKSQDIVQEIDFLSDPLLSQLRAYQWFRTCEWEGRVWNDSAYGGDGNPWAPSVDPRDDGIDRSVVCKRYADAVWRRMVMADNHHNVKSECTECTEVPTETPTETPSPLNAPVSQVEVYYHFTASDGECPIPPSISALEAFLPQISGVKKKLEYPLTKLPLVVASELFASIEFCAVKHVYTRVFDKHVGWNAYGGRRFMMEPLGLKEIFSTDSGSGGESDTITSESEDSGGEPVDPITAFYTRNIDPDTGRPFHWPVGEILKPVEYQPTSTTPPKLKQKLNEFLRSARDLNVFTRGKLEKFAYQAPGSSDQEFHRALDTFHGSLESDRFLPRRTEFKNLTPLREPLALGSFINLFPGHRSIKFSHLKPNTADSLVWGFTQQLDNCVWDALNWSHGYDRDCRYKNVRDEVVSFKSGSNSFQSLKLNSNESVYEYDADLLLPEPSTDDIRDDKLKSDMLYASTNFTDEDVERYNSGISKSNGKFKKPFDNRVGFFRPKRMRLFTEELNELLCAYTWYKTIEWEGIARRDGEEWEAQGAKKTIVPFDRSKVAKQQCELLLRMMMRAEDIPVSESAPSYSTTNFVSKFVSPVDSAQPLCLSEIDPTTGGMGNVRILPIRDPSFDPDSYNRRNRVGLVGGVRLIYYTAWYAPQYAEELEKFKFWKAWYAPQYAEELEKFKFWKNAPQYAEELEKFKFWKKGFWKKG